MGAIIRWLALIALVLGFAGAALGDPVEQPPTDPTQIRWDPAVRHGVLPNGLRYAVMHNATPAGGVSIRLGIAAGALDEADDELGAAHFLEHMAFGGSQAQLQASVEKAFADAGVAFGRDRNAQTSYVDTVFKIDLPRGDAAALDLGFRWLRQVADGAQLTPDTVDRERGVILAERETELSDLLEGQRRSIAFQAPGTRTARSGIIGTEASIAHLTAAQLQGFYDRWYQPRNAVVVVIGDETLDALEARVRTTFGGWTPRGPPGPPRPPARIDAARPLDVLTLAGPNLPAAAGVCRVQPAGTDPARDVAWLRRESATSIWTTIADARLADASKTPQAGLLAGLAVGTDAMGQPRMVCLIGVPLEGAWRQALATLQAQTVTLSSPPSEDELEAALKKLRAQVRGALFAAGTKESSQLADATQSAMMDGRAQPSPLEAMRAFDAAVEGMTPADVRAAFQRDWAGAGPLISILAPTAPTADAVKQAWLTNAGASPAPSGPPSAAPVWRYADFGRAGRVVKREVFPDFVRLSFANGVRLNFKQTAFGANAVSVRLRFGAGREGLAPPDIYAATIAGMLLPLGGLERDSAADIDSLFAEEGLKIQLQTANNAFVIQSRASRSGLSSDLQLLGGYVTQPGFRDLDGPLNTYWAAILRMVRGDPHAMTDAAMIDAVAPGNPIGLKAAQAASRLTVADLQRVLKPALTASPLVVTIVGDVDEKSATSAMAETLGALPPRPPLPPPRADAWFLRFPDAPPTLVTVHHDGPAEKAVVGLYWPLYVAERSRRREEYALGLVAMVYQDVMLRRIRGALGKAYAPTAATMMPDHADQGYLVATVDVGAADIDAIHAEMGSIAAQIARGDFTDEDIENTREPFLAALAKRLTSNDAWAGVLDDAAADPATLDDFKDMIELYGSITPAEVRKAAATWLSKAPIAVIVSSKPAAAAP